MLFIRIIHSYDLVDTIKYCLHYFDWRILMQLCFPMMKAMIRHLYIYNLAMARDIDFRAAADGIFKQGLENIATHLRGVRRWREDHFDRLKASMARLQLPPDIDYLFFLRLSR